MVKGDIGLLFAHQSPALWISHMPSALMEEFGPIMIVAQIQYGVSGADEAAHHAGWNAIGSAKRHEQTGELGAVALLVVDGVKGAAGLLDITDVVDLLADPIENILDGLHRLRRCKGCCLSDDARMIRFDERFGLQISAQVPFRKLAGRFPKVESTSDGDDFGSKRRENFPLKEQCVFCCNTLRISRNYLIGVIGPNMQTLLKGRFRCRAAYLQRSITDHLVGWVLDTNTVT